MMPDLYADFRVKYINQLVKPIQANDEKGSIASLKELTSLLDPKIKLDNESKKYLISQVEEKLSNVKYSSKEFDRAVNNFNAAKQEKPISYKESRFGKLLQLNKPSRNDIKKEIREKVNQDFNKNLQVLENVSNLNAKSVINGLIAIANITKQLESPMISEKNKLNAIQSIDTKLNNNSLFDSNYLRIDKIDAPVIESHKNTGLIIEKPLADQQNLNKKDLTNFVINIKDTVDNFNNAIGSKFSSYDIKQTKFGYINKSKVEETEKSSLAKKEITKKYSEKATDNEKAQSNSELRSWKNRLDATSSLRR